VSHLIDNVWTFIFYNVHYESVNTIIKKRFIDLDSRHEKDGFVNHRPIFTKKNGPCLVTRTDWSMIIESVLETSKTSRKDYLENQVAGMVFIYVIGLTSKLFIRVTGTTFRITDWIIEVWAARKCMWHIYITLDISAWEKERYIYIYIHLYNRLY